MPVNPTHTSKNYEQELGTLREKLLLMGSLVEEMIGKGATALSTRDTPLAQSTMRLDRRINRLECEVDELAMRILATRQPVASDLRFITTALKIVTDLERIGDLCVNICERVIELNEEPPLPPVADLESLAGEAIAVVHEALDVLVARDVDRARLLLTKHNFDICQRAYGEHLDIMQALFACDEAVLRRTLRHHVTNVTDAVLEYAKRTQSDYFSD